MIKISRRVIWITVFATLLAGVSIFSLCIGSSNVTLRNVLTTLLSGRGSTEYSILFNIRFPRIVLGFAIGGALSLAGVILQGMFRNPLVEPYTLGISGGAALGVCLNIVLRFYKTLGILTLPVSGFLGAFAVIILVSFLGMRRGTMRIQGFLLTGVMISFIASSLITLLMAVSRAEDLHGIVFWIMGSLDEPNWSLIFITLLISCAGLAISYLFCLDLNAFSLGEEEAQHLGVHVERTKRLLFLIASVLVGASVSVAGIIGFVGLVVPHFVRMIIGTDHRGLLVGSFLCGAAFLILCDTISRTIIAPMELPVGVITGILGGSLFVYAIAKKRAVFGEKQ